MAWGVAVASGDERKSGTAPGTGPLPRSPFVRLSELLAGIAPGAPPISLAVGEPQHPVPPFVAPVLADTIADFGRYPQIRGTDSFRAAAGAWLHRRYPTAHPIDPEREILVSSGSREALFLAASMARRLKPLPEGVRPAVLMPNPFYPAYGAGAEIAGCEAVVVEANRSTGFLPDLTTVPADVLARTVACYYASPANPQGAVASPARLAQVVALARAHGFWVFADECYSEIHFGTPPTGILEVAGPDLTGVVAFHSLSKRSNLPGLRCGFVAGDAGFIEPFAELRNVCAPQVPMPVQAVAVAAYADEAHVEENRALYKRKFDLAEERLGGLFGAVRPAGGFFLWLDVAAFGGGEPVTKRLWAEAGLRVVPGAYLARTDTTGRNAGEDFIRVALVQDPDITARALDRLVAVLGRARG